MEKETKSEKIDLMSGITPVTLKQELDKTVIGQEETKKALSVALFRFMYSFATEQRPEGCNILLTGPTGSGKSMLARKLAEISKLPYLIVDSSTLSMGGWKGVNIENVMSGLYEREHDRPYFGYAIVIFDELDKLIRQGTSDGTDYGKVTQSIFLSMMDGTPIIDSKSNEVYGTDRLMYIFTGAFTNIDDCRKEVKHSIGFTGVDAAEEEKTLRTELLDAGVIPELLGRLSVIRELEPLSEEDMFRAIRYGKEGVIAKEKDMFKRLGLTLRVDNDYVRDIIKDLGNRDLGVRGCNNLLHERIQGLIYDAYEEGKKEVYLTDI